MISSRARESADTNHTRPLVHGKFVYVDDEKLYLRGVTYGTFRPDERGAEYRRGAVRQDFAAMAARGFNAVRTYTVPPRWTLDAAFEHGLRVMVGIPWEQHVTFLDDRRRVRAIENGVRDAVRACAGHPGVLCYVVGNEIPAPIVRWYGRRRVERFIERLYRIAKVEDPGGLATYLNYPTTEYLQLPFLDLVCFNVYLEKENQLRKYMARLQNIADERPLVMGEIGLDSRRNGQDAQAEVLDWQVRSVFASGCAGAFVFAWTDEWHRGGFDVEDWDFGLTTRDRRPKPALAAVERAFSEVPFPRDVRWPRISVVVCVYNGATTIRECLDAVSRVDYPDFEVIVVDDGSKDRTPDISRQFVDDPRFRFIRTENRGLSSARNTGMKASTGEIVAYLDSDAYPDPQWLYYLAHAFTSTSHAGIGGPNIAPPGDGFVAACVASAPGGPIHVLLSDEVAEHIPGCNMAFRREALEAVGGFDSRFRIAGDDVDLCWRIQQLGMTIGYSPGAMVWHHTRNSVRKYWKQQLNYGKAEAMLERKWPEKYNDWGHPTWQGRIYGRARTRGLRLVPSRIYHGTWGGSPFQSIYEPSANGPLALLLMPEWYAIIAVLFALGFLGLVWRPALVSWALATLAVAAPVAQSLRSAARASRSHPASPRRRRARFVGVTAVLHLLQPLARLLGRVRLGLSPFRPRGVRALRAGSRRLAVWSEQWRDPSDWLASLEAGLRERRTVVLRGGPWDRWDLEVRGGLLGATRVLMTVEEHGGGRQMLKFRLRPKYAAFGLLLIGALAVLAGLAAIDGAPTAAVLLGLAALVGAGRALRERARATAAVTREVPAIEKKEEAQTGEEPTKEAAAETQLSPEGRIGGVAAAPAFRGTAMRR